MTDLVEFLRARLDEDERIAQTATDGPWSMDDEFYAEAIRSADGTNVIAGGRWGDEASVFEMTEDARHIAHHDPARVLREVDAKRRIIDEIARGVEYEAEGLADYVLSLLALPYATHPDYREEWKP